MPSRDESYRSDKTESREKDRKRSQYDNERSRRGAPHSAPKEEAKRPEPREFKIKDRSKLKHAELERQTEMVKDEQPRIDEHAAAREAANRERMLREQQRRKTLNQDRDRKRAHAATGEEEVGNGDHSRRSRRKARYGDEEDKRARRASHKYEDEENDETRAARIENEREAARWG